MRRRALLFLLALSTCVHPTRTARAPAPGEATLRVVTFNLNYGLAGDEETLAAIAAPDADLILLQETSPEWEREIRKALGARWPHQAFVHAPAAGGLAVLSKRAFAVEDVLGNPGGWFPAMRVVAQTPLGQVQALVVHLHPPVTEDGSWVRGYASTGGVRRAELEAWLPSLDPSLPTLVAGDFNEGTSGDAVQLLEDVGLRTALPEFDPRAKTWRWSVGPLQLAAQLDHVTYGPALEPLGAYVERRGRSDHFPVVVDFARAREARRPPAPSGSSLSVSLSAR
ncbi:MAG: endonuclease/exonuclease/phosphatase family protein [Myxococcota bacterium]